MKLQVCHRLIQNKNSFFSIGYSLNFMLQYNQLVTCLSIEVFMMSVEPNPLASFTSLTTETVELFHTLKPELQKVILTSLNTLHLKGMDLDKISSVLVRKPDYASKIMELWLLLHQLEVASDEGLDLIEKNCPNVVSYLSTLTFIHQKTSLKLNTMQTNQFLLVKSTGGFHYLLNFLNNIKKLTAERFDALLKTPTLNFRAYAECCKLLFKWDIFTPDNEMRLEKYFGLNYLHYIAQALTQLDESCHLSNNLFEKLTDHTPHAEAIVDGLGVLWSHLRTSKASYNERDALIIIQSAEAAKHSAGSLAFLIQENLDSPDNITQLLNTTPYATPVVILLYQLRCNRALNQEHFDLVMRVAPLLNESILRDQISKTSWANQLPLPCIKSALMRLNALSHESTETEKIETFNHCASLLNPNEKDNTHLIEEDDLFQIRVK